MNEEGEMVEDFPTMGKEAWKVFVSVFVVILVQFLTTMIPPLEGAVLRMILSFEFDDGDLSFDFQLISRMTRSQALMIRS